MSSRIEDLEVYALSEAFADEMWFVVIKWDYFVQDTVGKQLVRAADSISAILRKVLADIIIKKIETSVTSAVDRSSKLKDG